MPKRAWITSSQLRQGIGPLITLLLQGHEVALTHHGAPIGVIRCWTETDSPPTPDAERPTRKRQTRKTREPPKQQPVPQTGGQQWEGKGKFPTSHLKPTFSTPPE
jgi:hypothetical protein